MSDESVIVCFPLDGELYLVLRESAELMGLEVGELLRSTLCYSIAQLAEATRSDA